GSFYAGVRTRHQPTESAAHADAENAQTVGIDPRVPGQQRKSTTPGQCPMEPAGIPRRRMDLINPIRTHVAVPRQRSTICIFLATLPRSEKIIRQAGITAFGPILNPGKRRGLSTAVNMKYARDSFCSFGRSQDGKNPNLRSLRDLADIRKLL